MAITSQHNETQPRLASLAPAAGAVKCKFCSCTDLRVCGFGRRTYLGCPACSADGPMAEGIQGAVDAYLGRPGKLALPAWCRHG